MKHKYFILIMVTCALLLNTLIVAAATTYVGNASSHKFHYPSCRWAKKINSNNRVTFDSRQEAVSAGYVPCKVCKP
ncbi:MAG: hypothetical protein IJ563_02360 [Selenomonadaceae bacterium]|nr:hypothetical protein [Selenomonadaceae bacterium]MBR1859892.1 hypothetical protein [Selenomonadaceae bacterium]